MLHTAHIYEAEIKAWLEQVDSLQQENVQLKNNVADFIRHEISDTMLEQVELFLNSFIHKDAALALLRYDLSDQLKLTSSRKKVEAGVISRQEQLRRDMIRMEQECSRLKSDFYNYMAQVTGR